MKVFLKEIAKDKGSRVGGKHYLGRVVKSKQASGRYRWTNGGGKIAAGEEAKGGG